MNGVSAMTRQRRRLIVVFAVLAVLGALALPAVHWRLYGWWQGEPFYRGRPASYWRAQVAAFLVARVPSFGSIEFFSNPVTEPLEPAARWLNRAVGWPNLAWVDASVDFPLRHGGSESLGVLIVLLRDPDPKVRFYAAETLRDLRAVALPALPALRDLADDRARILPGPSSPTAIFSDVVGDIARDAITSIEYFAEQPDRRR